MLLLVALRACLEGTASSRPFLSLPALQATLALALVLVRFGCS